MTTALLLPPYALPRAAASIWRSARQLAALAQFAPPSAARARSCGGGRVELGRDGRLTRQTPILSASDAVSLHEIHETGRNGNASPAKKKFFSGGRGSMIAIGDRPKRPARQQLRPL